MTPLSSAEVLRLKMKIVETFDNERWQELGLLTNCADIITRHDRLLRSLAWGDSDYSGNVLAVITSIIGRHPSNAAVIRVYVDHGLEDQLDIASKPQLGLRIVFQPDAFVIPPEPIDPTLVAVMNAGKRADTATGRDEPHRNRNPAERD